MPPDRTWRVQPALGGRGDAIAISGQSTEGGWIGDLAETGRSARVQLDDSNELTVAIAGKRGSGKSYTMGVIIEALASTPGRIRSYPPTRAVLVFDPLDVFWTMALPLDPSLEHPEMVRQFGQAQRAGILGESVHAAVFVPGAGLESDPDWFQSLTIAPSTLADDDWSLLVDSNMVLDPMGQLLSQALRLTHRDGYTAGGLRVAPKPDFSMGDLAQALDSDDLAGANSATVNAVRQRLASLDGLGIFRPPGVRITDICRAGSVGVVLLQRLSGNLREVLISVLTRQLMADRANATQAAKLLATAGRLDPEEAEKLRNIVESGAPKTVVALDEAQTVLEPGRTNPAKSQFIRLVKEGRNLGLSVIVASQQASSIDRQVLSQVDTLMAHQLVTESDVRTIHEHLKSDEPTSITYGRTALNTSSLLRSLPRGYAVVTSSETSLTPARCFVMQVRPRSTIHGGFEV